MWVRLRERPEPARRREPVQAPRKTNPLALALVPAPAFAHRP